MTEKYSKDHVVFDGHELPVTLHCLCCNKVVESRAESPSKRDPGVMVHAMIKAPNYREVYVEMSDGSIAYLPFCSDCTHEQINPEKALAIVKKGWESALVHAGRPAEALELLRKRTDALSITRVGEISHAR